MNEKLEILQCLIENQAFAPSHSALAKELGYNGKMVIYRLSEGKVKDDTINKITEQICNRFGLYEEHLYKIARIFYGVKFFYDKLISEMDTRNPEWIKNLIISLTCNEYDNFSHKFKDEIMPVLIDLKNDERDVYWGIVAMIFIKANGIDAYKYIKKEETWKIVDMLENILSYIYPERHDAHEAAENMKRLNNAQALWNIIHNFIIIFRYYTEENFRNEALKLLRIFNFGKRSYWRLPHSSYGQDSEIWLLVCQTYQRGTNGFYIAMRMKAGKDIETFTIDKTLILNFWTIDKEDDPPVLQVFEGYGKERKCCFYLYEYDESQHELNIEVIPDNGTPLGLPETLQMINFDNPEGKDEKVWARILSIWDEQQGEAEFKKTKEAISGFADMSDAYHIKDVFISKTTFSLIIEHDGNTSNYHISVDKYYFLTEINPSQKIVIVKSLEDDALYASWPDRGDVIKLSEFTVK